MKLLILTQKIDRNDPILGFFHRWVEEFAKHCEQVVVICLEKGEYNLPENVRVLSLCKESSRSKIKYIINFYKYIWQERKNYDRVFVHMNPEYVILGGILWKILSKKIALWYTHKSVNLKLKLAEKIVDRIYTASTESFRLKSQKVLVTGHGIDLDLYSHGRSGNILPTDKYTVLSVGRISPTKNQHIMVESFEILASKGFNGVLLFIGAAVTQEDKVYEQNLKGYIALKGLQNIVRMVGPMEPHQVVKYYKEADLFINLSRTGSLDKAVLEAMASGLQILTSNEAFKNVIPKENFTANVPSQIASDIMRFSVLKKNPGFMEYVATHHGLADLICRLSKDIHKV